MASREILDMTMLMTRKMVEAVVPWPFTEIKRQDNTGFGTEHQAQKKIPSKIHGY